MYGRCAFSLVKAGVMDCIKYLAGNKYLQAPGRWASSYCSNMFYVFFCALSVHVYFGICQELPGLFAGRPRNPCWLKASWPGYNLSSFEDLGCAGEQLKTYELPQFVTVFVPGLV